MRIEFLENTFGNDIGDRLRVVLETNTEIYYYDGFGRYCYLEKSEEGIAYKVLPKKEKRNGKK